MIGQQLFLGLAELRAEISRGGYFLIAADEELLRRMPQGNWIGGTIPYFMTESGGIISRDKAYVFRLPSCVVGVEIKAYDEVSVAGVYSDAPDNGFSLMIVPASSKTHHCFAINAPKYKEFATSPLAGWVSGVLLDDPAKPMPKVFDGRFGKAMDNAAVVMHATLPKGKTAIVGIVNVFEPSDGDVLTFAADGFSAAEVIVNGTSENFAEYLRRKKLDTRLPLVTDNGGALMNVSFANVDSVAGNVRFYAPVFKDSQYRHAKPGGKYPAIFAAQKPLGIDDRVVFSCNCVLNHSHCGLEGNSGFGLTGPETFGEIAYQILNQTSVYIEIVTANLAERLRDETAVRRLNRELREQRDKMLEAKREAEKANLAKSQFLANMSHEIRTPMTAILGYLELLFEGCAGRCDVVQSESDHPLHVISRNAKHLLQLIDDILDVSKIEAGKMEANPTSCSPHGILTDVIALMKGRATAKGLSLDVEYTGPMPETIRTDARWLRQILTNIIGNAIKFTQVGGVHVVVGLKHAPQGSMLQIQIVDTGIGISEREMPRLFQAFAQADASTSRQFGGTGLGLTISKRLAELLGGELVVESTHGQGSSFTVAVPTGPLDGIRTSSSVTEQDRFRRAEIPGGRCGVTSLAGRRLLLAEDGLDNQRLIALLLKKAGAEVTSVENGRLARDTALAAAANGTPFDVVLMDMQMPVMDGYEATRQLRAAGYRRPVVALTAHAMAEDQQKCIDAGCDDYATKPVEREALLLIVAHWASGKLREVAEAPRTSSEAGVEEVPRAIYSGLADDP